MKIDDDNWYLLPTVKNMKYLKKIKCEFIWITYYYYLIYFFLQQKKK